MDQKRIRANLLLLLAAAIWGFAFVAQRQVVDTLGAFAFNGIRFMLGSISLLPLILFFNRKKEKNIKKTETKYSLLAAIPAGLILFTAAALQQVGIIDSTAGKAGFITGLYLVMVPVFGIFLKHKAGSNTWVALLPAIIGLYLLCINEGFSIGFGDLLILIGAFFWTAHILVIDHFSKKVDPLKLSAGQFAICGILSLITSLFTETIKFEDVLSAAVPICYGGFLSVGVAYTLQVVGQRHAKPSHAALLLSMEAVFGTIGGMLLLNETMTVRNLIGCLLIFSAILITQLRFPKKREEKQKLNVKEDEEFAV